MNSECYGRNPYATEQGIFSDEQGIANGVAGNLMGIQGTNLQLRRGKRHAGRNWPEPLSRRSV